MTLRELRQLPNEDILVLLNRIKEDQGDIPPEFKLFYEILEDSRIRKLPSKQRQQIFVTSKEEWCKLYPDFKRISDTMAHFIYDPMLVEYGKQTPPPAIHDRAIEIFKKCISFKVKFSKKIRDHLNQNLDTFHVHYCYSGIYCIKEEYVKCFLKDYQEWCSSARILWQEIYYLKQDFYFNAGYNIRSDSLCGWKFYITNPNLLKTKADDIETLFKNAKSLLTIGAEIIHNHDEAISMEYATNASVMSLYERESEIAKMQNTYNVSDEEYCYVYTLECDLFVFYVGIAANPTERFEQHIRGAFSDEAHLFKSKFIQKYHSQVKLNIIYEGTRRECKQFERDYIYNFSPLGNMTDGGEG